MMNEDFYGLPRGKLLEQLETYKDELAVGFDTTLWLTAAFEAILWNENKKLDKNS